MTPKQYWDGDCSLVKAYRKAHQLKKERRNQEMWLQGMYFYDALCAVSPVLHAFAKDGTKPAPYTSEPFPLTLDDLENRREREEKARYEKMRERFAEQVARINAARKATTRGKEDAEDG